MTYDPEADAVYVYLREGIPYAWGHDLGDDRHVDFGPDRKPIGIELLNVSMGVNVRDLPEQEEVTRLLAAHNIPVLSTSTGG